MLEEALEHLVKGIVDNPDDVQVGMRTLRRGSVLEVRVHPDDLGKVILSLGIGEAIVTVMNERGAPTPVAWTRLRAPVSLMGPADPTAMETATSRSVIWSARSAR